MLPRWSQAHAERDSGTNLSGTMISSPMKGTVMLSQLVKFQVKVAALRSDRGATAVEYGLMVALIAMVIIGAVTLLGGNLKTLFNSVATSV
jgi:pilus assembly protein Flp/PilA